MSKYEVNFKRLALLLLPTFLRRPLIGGIIYAAVSQHNYIHARFMLYRNEIGCILIRNGQVCHLRAILNDVFDSVERRITITDSVENSSALIISRRDKQRSILISMRGATPSVTVNRRELGGSSGFDFWINIPLTLQKEIDTKRLIAIVNNHKLVSTRYQINYM